MKGIGNLKPPKPKYEMIWDVEQVLNYLRSLPENKDLNLKLVTCKLTMLLALVAIKRVLELKSLDTKYMRHQNKYIFYLAILIWHQNIFPTVYNMTIFGENSFLSHYDVISRDHVTSQEN